MSQERSAYRDELSDSKYMIVCVCVCAVARDFRWKNSDVSIAVVHYAQVYSAWLFSRQEEVLTLGTLLPRTSRGQSTKYFILMFFCKGHPLVFKVH